MKLLTMLICILLGFPLKAASDEKLFLNALRGFYKNEPPKCLGMPEWPLIVQSSLSAWEKGRILALSDAGLIRKTRSGNKIVYVLTREGLHSQHKKKDICYGHIEPVRIIQISEPAKGNLEAYFTYRISGLKSWATLPGIRMAFSELDNQIYGTNHLIYHASFRKNGDNIIGPLGYPSPDSLDY